MYRGGFTLVDVIVGTALTLIIFVGFFGAYQLGLNVMGQSRARTTATALANQKIEAARNLPYKDVGTGGGIPAGILPETEVAVKNNISYAVKTTVVYIDDPFDGTAPSDLVSNDYKRVKVRVSWAGRFGGDVTLLTDIAPKGLESDAGTGSILVTVFDAFGVGVPQADLRVVNDEVSPPVDANFQTNVNGTFLIAGAPTSTQAYEITATKPGFSAERTYGTEEVATPAKPHATVLEGQLTEVSFAIDRLSTFQVKTVSPFGVEVFSDSFADESKISELSDAGADSGEVRLATTSATTSIQYVPSGYVISQIISPADLNQWQQLSWSDTEPQDTEIRYKVLSSGSPVPEGDLPGNSGGFTISPVDLSGLSTTTYASLQIRADLSTSDASSTPSLQNWQVSWKTYETTSVGNVTFDLRGNKTVGTDASEQPVYKYSQGHTTDSSGSKTISGLEWDSYTFSVDPGTGLNIVETSPSPQPLGLNPDTTLAVTLVLDAANELLVKGQDAETTAPVFSASVRLTNAGFGYDETQVTNADGETLFIPLEAATYSYEISAVGYQTRTGTISVSGDTTRVINLIPQGQ